MLYASVFRGARMGGGLPSTCSILGPYRPNIGIVLRPLRFFCQEPMSSGFTEKNMNTSSCRLLSKVRASDGLLGRFQETCCVLAESSYGQPGPSNVVPSWVCFVFRQCLWRLSLNVRLAHLLWFRLHHGSLSKFPHFDNTAL